MREKAKNKKTKWMSTRVTIEEAKKIKKLVKDGKYGSQSELIRTGIKLVLYLEGGEIEQMASMMREIREERGDAEENVIPV